MKRMVLLIIRLRFLQLYRGSGDLGLFRVLLLAVVLVPLIAIFLVQRIPVNPYSYAIPAVALYIVWLVHQKRKDYRLLVDILHLPKSVFLSEYMLFTAPVAALLASASLWVHLLVFYAVVSFISMSVPASGMKYSRVIKLRMIPAGMFEWQGGIRKNLVVLVIFYLAGLSGFFQVWLSAGSLLMVTLVFVSFYSEYEPQNMVAACDCRPWRFLAGKITRHVGCFALLMLPLLVIALTRGHFRMISVGYYLASLNLLAFSILLKYYQFRPAAYSGAHQLLTMLACFGSVILPAAVMLAGFNMLLAVGARNNLKKYLDDRT